MKATSVFIGIKLLVGAALLASLSVTAQGRAD